MRRTTRSDSPPAACRFDDQGRKFDAQGNLRDWWTADDATRFGELAGQLERQYSSYTVLDGLALNGKQTLGENTAANAGVSIAYDALQIALQGKPREIIDGFTPEQRFFLGWVQARRQTWRDQALRLTIQTGVHAPGEFRVNGPLSNMPEFAAAFGCTAGDAMVRAQLIRICEGPASMSSRALATAPRRPGPVVIPSVAPKARGCPRSGQMRNRARPERGTLHREAVRRPDADSADCADCAEAPRAFTGPRGASVRGVFGKGLRIKGSRGQST